jgi:hypothetical protein
VLEHLQKTSTEHFDFAEHEREHQISPEHEHNINYFKESQNPEEFAKLKEKFLQFYKINYCNQSFSTSDDTNIKDKTTLMHSIYKKKKISDDEKIILNLH